MRNARASALRRHGLKNGKNRDGNEGARKGLGCTRRSVRMDWFPEANMHGSCGSANPKRHPTANKIARQEPLFPFHEDGVTEWHEPRWMDVIYADEAQDVLDYFLGYTDDDVSEWEWTRQTEDQFDPWGESGHYTTLAA